MAFTFQESLAMKVFDIVDWVSKMEVAELEGLENAVLLNASNSSGTSGNMNYFIKPYMKFVPMHGKLEDFRDHF